MSNFLELALVVELVVCKTRAKRLHERHVGESLEVLQLALEPLHYEVEIAEARLLDAVVSPQTFAEGRNY